jgi:hypothetical protein
MTQPNWPPSPYGPDDQIGMLNEITPLKVLEAARLVKRGRVYDLGHILDEKAPAFPGRTFRQSLVTSAHLLNRRRPDAGPAGWGENNVNWIIELALMLTASPTCFHRPVRPIIPLNRRFSRAFTTRSGRPGTPNMLSPTA